MPFDRPSPFSTPNLLRIAITGGIGSGKSYICKQLADAGFPIFYCDDEAKRIIRTDTDVRRKLTAIVGDNLYDCNGTLVKSVLAAWLCRGKKFSAQVDAIVHPRVADAFKAKSFEINAKALASQLPAITQPPLGRTITIDDLLELPRQQTLFMECALLFESSFDLLADRSVLIHVSHATQLNRLMQRDHISTEKAEEWIALQLDEKEKIRRADHILPNDTKLFIR